MRGYQKKVIYLKDTGSDFFDEAYFIISRECEIAHIDKGDMVLEASRIIEESLGGRRKNKKKVGDYSNLFHLSVFFYSTFLF